MKKNKNGFTMIELVFVIVVLGILATIALPKFAGTKIQADISKGRADVSAVRSGIATERQSRLILGDPAFISAGALTPTTGGLFGGVLTYPIIPKNASGHWHTPTVSDVNNSSVNFRVDTTDVLFTYTRGNGIFTCNRGTGATQAQIYCARLID